MARHLFPSELNNRDPDFPHRALLWAAEAQCEMDELIAGTKNELATSRGLLKEIERMLARR